MTRTPSARTMTLAATAVLAAGALAGCGNGLSSTHHSADPAITQGSSDTPSSSATPTPSGAATTSPAKASGSGGGSASGSPDGRPASTVDTASTAHSSTACGPGDLAVGLRTPRGGGAAGSRYELLTFRNVSGATCTIDGHPGVSFVGLGNGTQLGVPASRTGTVHTVRLAPGKSGTALLQVVDAGVYDAAQCAPTTSDGLRVYPPDWRVSVFVPFRTQACQRNPGTSPQLVVSAVE
jgi:uncharacterized protein DUF4232